VPTTAKKPLPPRTASTPPPALLVGKAPAALQVKSEPPPKPVSVAPPLPAVISKPERQPSHTDIDLPPYIERAPSLLFEEDSDPDLLRRFQSDVVERRKRLTRIVATVVGVAWMLCQIACARTIALSVADAISSDDAPRAAKIVAKDVKAKATR
jgi:hypothetical protein